MHVIDGKNNIAPCDWHTKHTYQSDVPLSQGAKGWRGGGTGWVIADNLTGSPTRKCQHTVGAAQQKRRLERGDRARGEEQWHANQKFPTPLSTGGLQSTDNNSGPQNEHIRGGRIDSNINDSDYKVGTGIRSIQALIL